MKSANGDYIIHFTRNPPLRPFEAQMQIANLVSHSCDQKSFQSFLMVEVTNQLLKAFSMIGLVVEAAQYTISLNPSALRRTRQIRGLQGCLLTFISNKTMI